MKKSILSIKNACDAPLQKKNKGRGALHAFLGIKHLILILTLFLCLSSVSFATSAEGALKAMELKIFGQSYTSEPLEARVERLEHAFQVKPEPGDSLDYRITTLFGLEQRKVTPQANDAAIAAYNVGVDAANRGDNTEAISEFEEAVHENPGLMQAYNNWANILEKQGHYEQAVEIYERAIQYAPNEGLLHRNLGVMYERVGRIEDAIAEYSEYLSLTKTSDPPIESIVRNYEQNHAKGLHSKDYADFASNASEGRKLIWPQNLIPIPVYIQTTAPAQMVFMPYIEECFGEWESATHGRIKFKEVAVAQNANIRIILQPGPLVDPSHDVAHTQYDINFDSVQALQRMHMLITINTGDQTTDLSPNDRAMQVHRLVLHELGHAIGIWGHSLDPADIMYTHPIVSRLSNRDILTIQKLYDIQQ